MTLDFLRWIRRGWRLWTGTWPRRSALPSTSAVHVAEQGSLIAEAYRLETRTGAGYGLSIYLHGEEILRFDCLGAGGHWHHNLRQSMCVANGAVPRIFFVATEIPAQVIETLQLLERNLRATRDANWRTEVRATQWDADTESRFLAQVRGLLQTLDALPIDNAGHL